MIMKKLTLCAVSACAILSTAAVFASSVSLPSPVKFKGETVSQAENFWLPTKGEVDAGILNPAGAPSYVWDVSCNYKTDQETWNKINIYGGAKDAYKGYSGTTEVDGQSYNYPYTAHLNLSGTITYADVAPLPGSNASIVVVNNAVTTTITLSNCVATAKQEL
jgi:hypothetical protein